MRKYYPCWFLAALLLGFTGIYGQSIGIGTSSPNSSAQLDISSSSRGLLIPRITSAELSSIVNPARGLMVYDTVQNQLLVNMGTPGRPDWENIIANSGWGLNGNNVGGTIGTLGINQAVNFVAQGQPAGYLAGVNTAFGTLAMQYNQGANNTAIGSNTLNQGTGNYAVAVGNNALASNSGDFNIGIGWFAGYAMTSGRDNIAIGRGSMSDNTAGAYNVGIGSVALGTTTASEYNTVVGFNSAQAYDNGYNNVFVGANNDVTGPGYYNVIAIGQGVICSASSQARIGNSATNSIGGYANWTNFSDGRYKKNMTTDGVKGLDFIMRLRPITYNLDVTGIRAHLGQKAPADAGTQRAIADREGEVLSGFAAQEVEAAATASGYVFSGVDKPKNDKDFYGLRYGDFVVPLVKAVQEQQGQLEAQQQMIDEQRKLIEAMQKRLDEQDKIIQQLLKTK